MVLPSGTWLRARGLVYTTKPVPTFLSGLALTSVLNPALFITCSAAPTSIDRTLGTVTRLGPRDRVMLIVSRRLPNNEPARDGFGALRGNRDGEAKPLEVPDRSVRVGSFVVDDGQGLLPPGHDEIDIGPLTQQRPRAFRCAQHCAVQDRAAVFLGDLSDVEPGPLQGGYCIRTAQATDHRHGIALGAFGNSGVHLAAIQHPGTRRGVGGDHPAFGDCLAE